MVKDISKERLTIESRHNLDHITARTMIWAGGITASSLGQILARRANADTDKGGGVKVKPDLTIPNYPDIYVVGDLAAAVDAKGKPLPGFFAGGHAGGQYAANAILRKARGQRERLPFSTSTRADLR